MYIVYVVDQVVQSVLEKSTAGTEGERGSFLECAQGRLLLLEALEQNPG